MPSPPRLLSAPDRQAIAGLQLLARGVVEGITAGRHRCLHAGSSIEFKEHRQYVPGDEIRSIDWKLFGKTDRLYIRQYEDETNLQAMLLVDQSGSMGYAGSRSQGVSKHQYAVRLAACLASLLLHQQDAVGIATFDSTLREVVTPRGRASHLQPLLELLLRSQSGEETSLAAALREVAGRLRRRGLVILISDCFDGLDEVINALKLFRHGGSEVVIFQVWDPDELDFPFSGRTEFRCLESRGRQRIVDSRAVRAAYLREVETFQTELARRTAQERIELVSCTTDQAYTQVLSRYLALRGSGRQQSVAGASQPQRGAAGSTAAGDLR